MTSISYNIKKIIREQLKIRNRYENCFLGKYTSWDEAKKNSTGYDQPHILSKVLESTLKVKNGEGIFERDGVLFDSYEYPWPILTSLLLAALENNRGLKVLDFGGSLGSTYYQCRKMFKNIKPLEWSIVEQENYVAAGNKFIADDTIKFYNSIHEAYTFSKPNVLLMGSVLQYIEKPNFILDEVLNLTCKYIIIDRTPFVKNGNDDIITIQHVPENIYSARFPARLFNRENLVAKFSKKYELISEWNSFDCLKTNFGEVDFKGFLFIKSSRTC